MTADKAASGGTRMCRAWKFSLRRELIGRSLAALSATDFRYSVQVNICARGHVGNASIIVTADEIVATHLFLQLGRGICTLRRDAYPELSSVFLRVYPAKQIIGLGGA